MSVAEDDPRLVFIALDKATTLHSGLHELYINYWWSVHPTKGIILWKPRGHKGLGSAQCNTNKALSESLTARLYPWAECKQIPLVALRAEANDYA